MNFYQFFSEGLFASVMIHVSSNVNSELQWCFKIFYFSLLLVSLHCGGQVLDLYLFFNNLISSEDMTSCPAEKNK